MKRRKLPFYESHPMGPPVPQSVNALPRSPVAPRTHISGMVSHVGAVPAAVPAVGRAQSAARRTRRRGIIMGGAAALGRREAAAGSRRTGSSVRKATAEERSRKSRNGHIIEKCNAFDDRF